MGASFQAPCSTPGQRQMEMHRVSLMFFVFQYASTTSHLGMYKIDNQIKEYNKIIIIIMIMVIIKWE